ncbi:MAG: ATP-binding protein [Myxococcota bacterium]
MRWSYVRLVLTSVFVFGGLTFGVLVVYGQTLSWDESRARGDGVFHVHALLRPTAVDDRADQLAALQPHFRVPLRLVARDEVARELGQVPPPGDDAWHHVRRTNEWWVVPFGQAEPVLVAGPVDPTVPPPGYLPMGAIVALVGLPLLATALAMRFDREVALVERATDALATGELGVRVTNDDGPAHELSQRFNAMADRIERLIRSRDELVQAVSHELGSPLSRLRFHLELLDEVGTEARVDRLLAMTRELDALDELVAELLTFVQAADRRIDRTTFDPAQGLADLAELARLDQPDERPLSIDVVIPSGVRLYADRRLFFRAVENLIRNAVRHATSRVRVEAFAHPGAVEVWVDDDGPGIPEPLRSRLTEPFARLDTDRGRETGGVGLGLAIVHRILERHGGQLEVTDSPFGGARFVCRWTESTG